MNTKQTTYDNREILRNKRRKKPRVSKLKMPSKPKRQSAHRRADFIPPLFGSA